MRYAYPRAAEIDRTPRAAPEYSACRFCGDEIVELERDPRRGAFYACIGCGQPPGTGLLAFAPIPALLARGRRWMAAS